jgi:hypothetical protein
MTLEAAKPAALRPELSGVRQLQSFLDVLQLRSDGPTPESILDPEGSPHPDFRVCGSERSHLLVCSLGILGALRILGNLPWIWLCGYRHSPVFVSVCSDQRTA